jgi:1A family penicillin-binding protein
MNTQPLINQIRDAFRKSLKAVKKNRKLILKILKYVAFFVLGMVIFMIALFFYYTYDLPRPEAFTETPFIQSTKIYDRTGKVLLYDIYGEQKRQIVSFDKISDNLKHAIIASEDARFYHHGGVDLEGILRSILVDLKLQSASEGASTITQQLIRTVYLSNQKTLQRKVREIVLAIELEKRYSKDQILDWYLNEIPFGQNAYGAEAASQTYFNVPASSLSIAQAATLTAVIKAPSYYSPYGSHKDELLQRKNYIIKQMKDQGYITEQQMKDAQAEVLNFSDRITSIKAPHFVMYVQQYLEDKYGDDYLKEKGLKIYTTIDWDIQEAAEKAIEDSDANIKRYKANNAAAVVIDPKTGEILALVGSKDYFGKSYPEGCDQKPGARCLFDPQFDVATMGQRQPGSSFKPFVYATAFKEGYTPNTILWDVKTEFNSNCSPDGNQVKDPYGGRCYNPQDYDSKSRGPISVRNALDQSLNIPAVEMLYLVGVKDSLQTAHDMGITTLNQPDRYGLSLVLGGGEVTLLDMTSAYSVFATEGQLTPPVSILKIEDSDGNILEQNNKQPTKVLDTQVARQINDVLSDNNARAPIFGVNNPLHFNDYQVAAKTGTTEMANDAWTMGYTPFAAVGVWVGNNDNSPTTGESTTLAAPIWHKIMQKILDSHAKENFTPPDTVETPNPILLGQLPADQPPHSILYYINKNDPKNPNWPNPNTDPLFPNWEQAVQNWVGATQPAQPQNPTETNPGPPLTPPIIPPIQ